MIVEETVNKFVRDVINTVLATADFAIKAQQDAPRPVTSYASVNVVSMVSVGEEVHTYVNQVAPDVDLLDSIEGYREIFLSLNFFFDGARDNAEKTKTGFKRNSVQELLKIAGLGLVRQSDVRDISVVDEDGWEKRAQYDLTLSAVGTDSEIVAAIASVSVGGDLQFRGSSNNVTIEV